MINKIGNVTGIQQPQKQANSPGVTGKNSDFAAALSKADEQLKISAHAQKRLNSSQVTLSDSDFQRIGGAVEKASQKGSNQSLIMLDNMAFVVSVKNKVVITAVDEPRMQAGVFTNIDSVVIA